MSKINISTIIFALLTLGLSAYLFKKYRIAPELNHFELECKNPGGEIVNLKPIKGKKVIVSYWQSWCGPCLQEMKMFNEIKKEKGDRLIIYCISDESFEKTAPITQNYPDLIFLQTVKTFKELGVNTYPTNYIFDENGNELIKRTGTIERSEIE